MARAFTVVENDVFSVVFCREHGSTAPRNSRRRARTDKVGRIYNGHYVANFGDPKVELLEVGCTDALVQKSLEDYVLELAVRRSSWRVARIKAFVASVELIQEFVGPWPGFIRAEFILACSALSASLDQPSSLLRRAAHVRCPCSKPSSSVFPARRRTTEHAAPFVAKNSTLYKSLLAVFQAASLEPSVSIAADGTGAPCRARKATLS